MTLDPTFVPEKYHPFIVPALRRIYLNTDPSSASVTSRQLQEQLAAVKKENEDLVSKLESQDLEIKSLVTQCESAIARAVTHTRGEREARLENEQLRHEMSRLAERYRALQAKSSQREHRTGSPREDEGGPNDDPRQAHSRSQSRLVRCA